MSENAEIRSPAAKQMDPRPLYANSEPWECPLVSEKPEEEPSAAAGRDVHSHLTPEGQFMFPAVRLQSVRREGRLKYERV